MVRGSARAAIDAVSDCVEQAPETCSKRYFVEANQVIHISRNTRIPYQAHTPASRSRNNVEVEVPDMTLLQLRDSVTRRCTKRSWAGTYRSSVEQTRLLPGVTAKRQCQPGKAAAVAMRTSLTVS